MRNAHSRASTTSTTQIVSAGSWTISIGSLRKIATNDLDLLERMKVNYVNAGYDVVIGYERGSRGE